MATRKDPTKAIKLKASRYPEVVEGTACTQSSFKANKKGFLYIGEQGGRYKAMFKLQTSIPEATKLAVEEPDCFAVGKGGWVTARFTEEDPLPTKLWQRWLEESYALAIGGSSKGGSSKGRSSKSVKKKVATKKAVKKNAKKNSSSKKTKSSQPRATKKSSKVTRKKTKTAKR